MKERKDGRGWLLIEKKSQKQKKLKKIMSLSLLYLFKFPKVGGMFVQNLTVFRWLF
jgi:hypothetical protein